MPDLSILIPSLFPPLVERLIKSIDVDAEVVVCSPERVERAVWVEDTVKAGCDPAIRQAFRKSTGDSVIVMADDHVFVPGALAKAIALWDQDELMDLNAGWVPRIFGSLSVAYPLCHRATVENLYSHFFPYTQHFGDHSFALAARAAGYQILQCPHVCVSYPWEDRLGCPESPTKTSSASYDFGKFRIYDDFPEYSKGWEGREDFNS